MEHAGIGPDDVDEIVLGHFNAGFSAQDFTASLVLQADDRLRFKPATRVENACATGSAAIRQGIRSLEAKASRIVLVVGCGADDDDQGPGYPNNLRVPPTCPRKAIFRPVLPVCSARSPAPTSNAMATSRTRWPRIAAKNHRNGVDNPYAQMRKDLGYDFCRTRRARRTRSWPGR